MSILSSGIKNLFRERNPSRILDKIKFFYQIEGWLTDNEAIGLFTIANELRIDSKVVEIGSWKGKSTYCIAKGLKKGVIHCIDPFNADGEEGSKEIYELRKGVESLSDIFQSNLSSIGSRVKIEIHKGYSSEFINTISAIDFLFIDGDHSIEGCKYDYLHYAPDVKIGGYLAFHDYDPLRHDLGPTWVIDNLVRNAKSFELFKSFDSLVIFKKISH